MHTVDDSVGVELCVGGGVPAVRVAVAVGASETIDGTAGATEGCGVGSVVLGVVLGERLVAVATEATVKAGARTHDGVIGSELVGVGMGVRVVASRRTRAAASGGGPRCRFQPGRGHVPMRQMESRVPSISGTFCGSRFGLNHTPYL